MSMSPGTAYGFPFTSMIPLVIAMEDCRVLEPVAHIDNDEVTITDSHGETVYEGHPSDMLTECLTMLGIPSFPV